MMKYCYCLLLLLLLMIIYNCGCSTKSTATAGQPVWLQTTGGIIFVKSNSEDTQIWYRNLANGQETLLYDYGRNISEPNPVIYPNHNTDIVLADKNGESYDLYTYNLLTKIKKALTINNINVNSKNTDRHPSFGVTGDKMVFQSAIDGKTKFYFVGPTSAGKLKPYDDEGGSVPVISPDGTKVAYVKEVKPSDNTGTTLKTLFIYNLTAPSGENNPQKFVFPNTNVDNPAWDANSETIAFETYVTSAGPRFIATIKPFVTEAKLQQVVYSWGKSDDYRHPAWGMSGGRTILFFTGKLLTANRYALGAVYYDEVLAKGAGAGWYLVAADSTKKIEEPCWAPDLKFTAPE